MVHAGQSVSRQRCVVCLLSNGSAYDSCNGGHSRRSSRRKAESAELGSGVAPTVRAIIEREVWGRFTEN